MMKKPRKRMAMSVADANYDIKESVLQTHFTAPELVKLFG